jgi:rRNA maturation protein Rpf1
MVSGSVYINRGRLGLEELTEEALSLGQDRLLLLARWKGAPGKMELYTLTPTVRRWFPVIYLHSVATQREFGKVTRARTTVTNIAIEGSNSEVQRLAEALGGFFEISKVKSETEEKDGICMSFGNARGHTAMMTFKRLPEQAEIGPRLVVRHLAWSEKGEGS